MMGVELSTARSMRDNQSLVTSGSFLESTLKKQYSSILYHNVREAIVAKGILIYYEKTASNITDLFTKSLAANKYWTIIQGVLS